MDAFLGPLKQAAREKRIHWKLVCCGPRGEAFRRFRNALDNTEDAIIVLLVDAEGPTQAEPRAYLQTREEGWHLTDVDDRSVHLMVQMMEAWIVADADALMKLLRAALQPGRVAENR